MGGGAGLINRYSENQPEMITFIDDIRANAAGYELLANSVEKGVKINHEQVRRTSSPA